MADIPTISNLQSSIENDLRTQFNITVPWYGKVALRVLSIVQATKLKLVYLLIASVQKNIFVDTADSELQGGTLERFGRVKLGRNPYPAQSGIYTINITGIAGGVIDTSVTFKSSQGSASPNMMYQVVESVTLSGTTGSVQVVALVPGESAVLIIGDPVEATAPILNVNSKANIISVDDTPVDAESLEVYRQKTIESFQLESQGGSFTDYRIWAFDAVGVRTVYPYTKNGATYTVQVFVEALKEDTAPGQPVGFPPDSMLTDVRNVIEQDPDTSKDLNDRGRRPVQAIVEVLAVVPSPVTVTLVGLSDKSTDTLNLISNAIDSYLLNIRPYIAGADGTVKHDSIFLSGLIAAIYNAIGQGINFSSISFTVNGSVYTSYTFGDVPSTYGTYPYLQSLLTP